LEKIENTKKQINNKLNNEIANLVKSKKSMFNLGRTNKNDFTNDNLSNYTIQFIILLIITYLTYLK